MRQRVLITGIGGFAGRHLAALLRRRRDVEVLGLGTSPASTAPCHRYAACNLTDADAVRLVIDDLRPDVVYHLAGKTSGATAAEFQATNVVGFETLCGALRATARRRGRSVRLVTVGTAAELGTAGLARLPVLESAPCSPETDYGRSKHAATLRALQEPVDGPLRISVARTFNLVGPGMDAKLSLGRFAAQITAHRRGELDVLQCGNLAARRDFVDVRDAAAAYVAIAARGRPGELYNVCSGRSHQIGDLLEQLLRIEGRTVPVRAESAPPRPGDVVDVYGDPTKTAAAVGWRAVTPIECSLRDLLFDASCRLAA